MRYLVCNTERVKAMSGICLEDPRTIMENEAKKFSLLAQSMPDLRPHLVKLRFLGVFLTNVHRGGCSRNPSWETLAKQKVIIPRCLRIVPADVWDVNTTGRNNNTQTVNCSRHEKTITCWSKQFWQRSWQTQVEKCTRVFFKHVPICRLWPSGL